jgi:uncharacterized membrane protein
VQPRRLEVGPPSTVAVVAASSQRRALRALFAVLTAAFLLIGFFAAKAGVWPVAVAAVALGLWMGTLAAS